MTDMWAVAERLQDRNLTVEKFSEELIGQMNIHDRHEEECWCAVADLIGFYARERGRVEVLAALFQAAPIVNNDPNWVEREIDNILPILDLSDPVEALQKMKDMGLL